MKNNFANFNVLLRSRNVLPAGNENQRSQIGSDGAETPGSQSVNIQSEGEH